jgi:hypothetical protein
MNDLLKPWESVEDQATTAGLERELGAKIPPDHVLAGKKVRAVARRIDQDDVLFEIEGGGYAVVHLTWTGRREQSRAWPAAETFESLDDWKIRRMKDDNADYASDT